MNDGHSLAGKVSFGYKVKELPENLQPKSLRSPRGARMAVGETVISMAHPCTFSRFFNRDEQGVSSK